MLDAPVLASAQALTPTLMFLVLVGTLSAQFLNFTKGLEGTVPRLRGLLPNRTDAFYAWLDLIIVSGIGTVVALIFFAPGEPKAAFMAGFGFASALNATFAGPKDAPPRPAPTDSPQPGGNG